MIAGASKSGFMRGECGMHMIYYCNLEFQIYFYDIFFG